MAVAVSKVRTEIPVLLCVPDQERGSTGGMNLSAMNSRL